MLGPKSLQPSTFEGGLDDLESFQAWAEEIKTFMSQANPPLYEVLGQTAASKVPIEEEELVKTSQDVLKETHRTLRVLQAKIARAGMTEQQLADAGALNEDAPPEADQQTEFDWKLELEKNKLQVQTRDDILGTSWFKRPRGRPSFRSDAGSKTQTAGKLGGNSTCCIPPARGVRTSSFCRAS